MVIARRSCVYTGKHVLTGCHECDEEGVVPAHLQDVLGGGLCPYCDGRGYYEVCLFCGEPMGNERRKWKRARRRNGHSSATDDTEKGTG